MRHLPPIRVLHIGKFYPPHHGGIETYLQVLCEQLQNHVRLKVIVSGDCARTTRGFVNAVEVVRTGTLLTLASAPLSPGMWREIRRSPADLVHMHLPNPAAAAAYLASGHSGRLVISHHGDIVRQKLLGKMVQPILRRLFDRSSVIIAASDRYIETSPVLSQYSSRCQVIPYGIPLEGLSAAEPAAVAEIRQRYGPRVILTVGRLVYYKGFEHLIQAMASLDARLLIVGTGPLRERLKTVARAHGVAGRVVFLGEVGNVVPYYQAADVFVLPSIARSEAFGIVQVEAMACGVPVVNTQLPSGVPFVSLDGVTGLTVPPADSAALAGAIRMLLEREDLRRRFGEAAKRRAQQEFTAERMADRTLRLYRDVLSQTACVTHSGGSILKPALSPPALSHPTG